MIDFSFLQHKSLTSKQVSGMKTAIIMQCFSAFILQLFKNGLFLTFFLILGMDRSKTILVLSLPFLIQFIAAIPNAYLADCFGRKKLGLIGCFLNCIAFILITLSCFCAQNTQQGLLIFGIIIYGYGTSLVVSSWFALMDPIVPSKIRAHFWGTLRACWQIFAIIFGLFCSFYLLNNDSIKTYQVLFIVITLFTVVRLFLFKRMPALESQVSTARRTLISSIKNVAIFPGYMGFSCYLFMLSIFTLTCPTLFGLVEKNSLDFSDGMVVFMGNLTMIGSVLGFTLIGRIIDRLGIKPVFMWCHILYGFIIFCFIFRGYLLLPMPILIGAIHLIQGLVIAFISVAITSQLMELIDPQNKSLATTICLNLYQGGGAIAGIIISWILQAGALTKSWKLGSITMTDYDSVLLFSGIMICFLVITLSLIPAPAPKEVPISRKLPST